MKVAAQIENRGLGAIKPTIILADADGNEIARQDVLLEDGARATATFALADVPESGAEYTLLTAPWPGEQVPANNAATVHAKWSLRKRACCCSKALRTGTANFSRNCSASRTR